MGTGRDTGAVSQSNAAQSGERSGRDTMSRTSHTAHRIAAAVIAATIVSTALGGLTSAGSAQALANAPMAKCIPGQGNPLNPCP
jgi:hypothetical protein